MKTLLKLILVVMMCMATGIALSQENDEDVVYLKTGGILRGSIVELAPDQYVKIETAEGNVFVYQMNEIEKITKETAYARQQKKPVDKTGLKRGYYGMLDFNTGITFGEFKGIMTPGLNLINGYRVNPYFATGLGFGMRFCPGSGVFIPLFSDLRVNFENKPTSTYLSLGTGYGFSTRGTYNDDYSEIKGGLLISPSFGGSVKLTDKSFMTIGISYDYQQMKITNKYYYNDYYSDGYYSKGTLTTKTKTAANHSISLKIGIGF